MISHLKKIIIGGDGGGQVRSYSTLSLAGKFFTSLVPPSFDRTESTRRQQWKLSGGLKEIPLEKDDIILFEFEEKRDKKEVINRGPWNVDGIILVLKECPQGISMADIDFSVACFKVKVIGLPKFNYSEAEKIVKKLSDEPLISLKYNDSTSCFWVKTEINLKEPLTPGFYINGRSRRRPFVQFKYKNLGDFCEHCGMISHRKCGEVAKKRPLTREFKTHDTITSKFMEMIDMPLGKSDDLLMKTIQDAISEVITPFPEFYV